MTWTVDGKTALVTGGNSGIGKEIAAGLLEAGARVVLPVRSTAKGEAARDELVARTGNRAVDVAEVDFASLASVRGLAKHVLDTYDDLPLLVNNAGGTWSQRRETEDGHEMTFQVNHLGAFLLTNLLLDRVKASGSARIVTTSSGAHKPSRGLDFDDLDRRRRRYRGMGAYNDSKLCNIYFTRELARRLEGSGVTANCFHPGFVRTNFAREGDTFLLSIATRLGTLFARTPHKGAETGLHLATSAEVEGVSGEYFFDNKVAKTAPRARHAEVAARLWSVSEDLTGVSA